MNEIRDSQQRAGRTLLCFASALVLAALARDAAAQEPELSKRDRAIAEETMRSRNRSTMHPGDPLVIVGQEQGGNEIRSRTPALQNATNTAAQVDPEELYQRALAVYGERATFRRPPAAHGSGASASGGTPAPRTQVEASPTPPVAHGPASGTNVSHDLWAWLVGATVSLGLIAWFVRRGRSMFMG